MAYIGNTPAEAYISISSQTFTTINGTDYTLSSSVTNSEDIALFLNNVRQKPSTYTATGTALTMGTATTTADELYCVYLGKGIQTVTPPAASVGTSSIADLAVTTAKLAGDAVTTAKILDDNVTTDKILDSNVTYAKIQDTTTANRVIGAATAGAVSEVQVVDDMTNFESTASAAGLTVKGDGTTDGYLALNCSQNTHGIKLKSPAHSDAQTYTLTFPGTAPAADKYFKTDGSGNLSWVDINVGDIAWQAVTTATTLSAVAANGYPINTTSNACTVTLPAGSVGDTIEFVDYAGTWDTNNVTLTTTEKIKGSDGDAVLSTERQGVKIVYMDATQGWVAVTGINSTSPALPLAYSVEYLVLAGGGGGGGNYYSAAGGAGGYRTNRGGTGLALVAGEQYTATVGTGGAGGSGAIGVKGLDSSLAGTGITTITSNGGGYGGRDSDGGTGGSGGGGANTGKVGGAGNEGGDGGSPSIPEGFDGGEGSVTNSGGGGGGGASEVGGDAPVSNGGVGGDGLANDIIEDGTDVTYAGGGGGGAWNGTGAAGGAGGGGTGGQDVPSCVSATDGTDGLGGGGGGACGYSHCGGTWQVGGDGGDGVVVLRMLTTDYTGTTTGSPTITTDGSYTVLKFTGTGTYTA